MIVRHISPQHLHKSSRRARLSSPRCLGFWAYCPSVADVSGRGWNRGCATACEEGGVVGRAGVVRVACDGGGAVVARPDRARSARAGIAVLRGSVARPVAAHATGTAGEGRACVRIGACSACPRRHAVAGRGCRATIRRAQDTRAIRAEAGQDTRATVGRCGSFARFRLAPRRCASGGHAARTWRARRATRTQSAGRTIRDRARHRQERAAAMQERPCGHGLAGLAASVGGYRYGSGLQVVTPKPSLPGRAPRRRWRNIEMRAFHFQSCRQSDTLLARPGACQE